MVKLNNVKTIKHYRTNSGKNLFDEWLNNKVLDLKHRARVLKGIKELSFGYRVDSKRICKGLFELRFHFGSGYRVYFTEQRGEIILLLLGGDKGTQDNDIAKAKKYLKAIANRGVEA